MACNTLIFHPNAEARIDQLGIDLVQRLQVHKYHRTQGPEFPAPHISHEIKSEDVIAIGDSTTVDAWGNEEARFFQEGNELVGLSGDSHLRFLRVVELIQGTRSFKESVSTNKLKQEVFQWLRTRYGNVGTPSLSEHLVATCSAAIHEYQVWIPIAFLKLQSHLEFGPVTFHPVTKNAIDTWTEDRASRPVRGKAEQSERVERLRKGIQGYASAVTTITAERERAIEVALERADYAVSMLRLYHPATMFPQPVAFCDLLGKEHIATTTALTFDADAPPLWHKGVAQKVHPDWEIPDVAIPDLMRAGIAELGKLMLVKAPNEYQVSLQESLLIYSRVSLCDDLSDKLVYLFAALERFLLKNQTEPIDANLAERMAWVVGETVEQRLAIARNVKEVYGFRSRFLHHGRRVKEVDKLKPFMFSAWALFIKLIGNKRGYATREELFSEIERWKFGEH